jgi:heme/copper-type cytochrome/quinol oxidase subunit 2
MAVLGSTSMAKTTKSSLACILGMYSTSRFNRLNGNSYPSGNPMFKHFIFMFGLSAACSLAQSQAISTEAWHAVPDAQGVQVINIECGSGFVDPHEIVVKNNRPVELRVRTSEPSQEFISDLSPGQGKAIGKQSSSQRFTPTANGRFAIGCQKQGDSLDPNSGKGKKKGLLTVVPDNGVK